MDSFSSNNNNQMSGGMGQGMSPSFPPSHLARLTGK